MQILEAGHVYALFARTGVEGLTKPAQREILNFVNREPGREHSGTQTQEVLRALIDRTMHCHNCDSWEGNREIIYHMRMALVLHEARALIRKVQRHELAPEYVAIDADGHFRLEYPVMIENVSDGLRGFWPEGTSVEPRGKPEYDGHASVR